MPGIEYLHPMVVHFPIALLIVGFLAEVTGFIVRREYFHHVALLLLLLGTAGLIAAYISGTHAGGGVTEAGALKEALEQHQEAALLTLWIVSVTAVVRLTGLFMKKHQTVLRGISAILFLLAVLSLARTGHYGGELVFKHAAGVSFNFDLNNAEIPDSTDAQMPNESGEKPN